MERMRPDGMTRHEWLEAWKQYTREQGHGGPDDRWNYQAIVNDELRKKAVQAVLDRMMHTKPGGTFNEMPYLFKLEMTILEMAESREILASMFPSLRWHEPPQLDE